MDWCEDLHLVMDEWIWMDRGGEIGALEGGASMPYVCPQMKVSSPDPARDTGHWIGATQRLVVPEQRHKTSLTYRVSSSIIAGRSPRRVLEGGRRVLS